MPLSPSMWDVALFIGRAEIGGIVASVYLAFLLSMTMFKRLFRAFHKCSLMKT